MVYSCCAYGCKERYVKGSGISFHSFPKDQELKRKWIIALKRDAFVPTVYSKLCSKHFARQCFVEERFGARWLKSDAIPSLFEFPHHLVKKNTPRKPPKSRALSSGSTPCEALHQDNFGSVQSDEISPPGDGNPQMESLQPGCSRDRKRPLRYMGDFSEVEMTSPRKATKFWSLAKEQIEVQKKRIKYLQTKESRLKKRIDSLKSLLNDVKGKFNMSDSACSTLEMSVPSCVKEMVGRMEQGVSHAKYPEELRSFALTLNFYSSKAYNYVRSTFNLGLPHPATLRKWYSVVDGAPGMTSEALSMLKMKADEARAVGKKVYCGLMFDEMAIRKHVEWDGSNFSGYIDYGTNLDDDELPVAKEALVFMTTCLNGSWKVPVSYYLIDGLSASERANLVLRIIEELNETGVEVVSLTFDGTSTNLAMSKILGASIDPQNLSADFKHQGTGKDVHVLLDACHMLKLVRNTLASKGCIVDAEGGIIKWEYIAALQRFQVNEGLHAANKLKPEHINWFRQKMKVKIAAQTLSNSVATALEYLNKDLKVEEFKGSEATVKFIRYFNNLFDVLNSRNLLSKGFKSPIKLGNISKVIEFLDDVSVYIKGLKQSDNGPPLLSSNRKTGFLGFLMCIDSVKKLSSKLLSDPFISFILTYKMSQDHVETFFSAVRSRGGHNNNPTARQFKAAYKRLLVHNNIKCSLYGNCLLIDNTNILFVSSNVLSGNPHMEVINKFHGETGVNENTYAIDDDHPCTKNCTRSSLSLYVSNVVEYISGFVQKKILSILKCEECLEGIEGNHVPTGDSFLARKNKGGLVMPSNDIVKICKVGERVFRVYDGMGKITKRGILPILMTESLSQVNDAFTNLKSHILDQSLEENHINNLIRAVLLEYFKIRLYHKGQQHASEMRHNYVRNLNTKLTLFKGH